MSLFSKIQEIKAQISDTERLLNSVGNHPVMSLSIKDKLEQLQEELRNLPEQAFEPKIRILFSGNAVKGSTGIKSSFISKTLPPFQGLVRSRASENRRNREEGQTYTRRRPDTDLYLTALPKGSFGVELSQLEDNDTSSEIEVSNAIRKTIELIHSASESNEEFERATENVSKQSLNFLKAFLKEVSDEQSIIKIESGDLFYQIPEDRVRIAYHRVEAASIEEEEVSIIGILRGILLDSSKFEITNEEGRTLRGSIYNNLSESDLVSYSERFINKRCRIHMLIHTSSNISGNTRIKYELLGIDAE